MEGFFTHGEIAHQVDRIVTVRVPDRCRHQRSVSRSGEAHLRQTASLPPSQIHLPKGKPFPRLERFFALEEPSIGSGSADELPSPPFDRGKQLDPIELAVSQHHDPRSLGHLGLHLLQESDMLVFREMPFLSFLDDPSRGKAR